MPWVKCGCIFEPTYGFSWMASHAMLPTPLLLKDKIRVYYCARGADGKSRTSFFDARRDDPTHVLYVHPKPVLEPETLGTFDDCGALPGAVLKVGKTVYLYYVGYNIKVSVPYSNAIGLAVSQDNGRTFTRKFLGPILDRNALEPYFTISPCVLKEGKKWRMWYASGTEWIMVNGKPESLYHIKYAESKDGLCWERKNHSCIRPLDKKEANARPAVLHEKGVYKMWYSYRGSEDFRDGAGSYRIGYAESKDGIAWKRLDTKAGIAPSRDGWDAKMLAYPGVLMVDGRRYLFYNGNGFGASGIGLARWVEGKKK